MIFFVLITICFATCITQKKMCGNGTFEQSFDVMTITYTCCPCIEHCNHCLNSELCNECEPRYGLIHNSTGGLKCIPCEHAHCAVCGERSFGGKLEEQCFRCIDSFKKDENGNCVYDGDAGYEQVLLFDIIMSICGLFFVVILAFKQMNRKYQQLITDSTTTTKDE
ncbi:hypothetical protein EDI_246390 [Entamoeba dispar SAW760]|uniref:Uncharacterized protein n=1 Tax=Entamoeba dispar (strain ATCC PRA-260 / SAW760) TaxID=370354 RepID=B0EEP7_ENTDS|nr:uncharacterized protein EDI_246390 [Entamoeba dispar SAW760]EDR27023.1 hypothetical protein EDI_246390 [Entamoeba dispar SAW760]|eukprot:EDR27023.1 hypothetical protein EDI_246390 [Entamoeba dispar SAW760]